MVTWVGAFSKNRGVVSVLQVILDVAHLMVDSPEVFPVHHRAHFDPELKKSSFTWVCSVTEYNRLVFVLKEVLDMAHFVVRRLKILVIYCGALFDPSN